jgi:DNA topoisomerase-1
VLDEISRGERESLPYLREFYFGENGGQGLKKQLASPIDAREVCTIEIGKTEDEPVVVRVGRYGPYLQYGEERTSIDMDTAPSELTLDKALELIRKGGEYPKELGTDPDGGQPVLLKKGRYGFYLQLGDDETKLKQKSLLPGMQPEEVNLEVALSVLALPREVGRHPESGEAVLADIGRYGPYIKCGDTNRSLPAGEDVLTLELDRALEILKTKGRSTPAVLRSVGQHPETKVEIQIKDGRYGPYITDGKVNVSLKKGEDSESIGIEEAVARLAEKAAKGPTKRRYPKRRKKN